MADHGREAPDPEQQFFNEDERVNQPVAAALGDRSAWDDPKYPVVLDEAWFDSVLERSPELCDVFEDEIEAAVQGRGCRLVAFQPIADEVNSVCEEVLGVPFDES